MIDPESPIPVYRQIAAVLIERIEASTLRPNKPIPSETALQQEFNVSRDTARRTVAWLRDEGWIYTVPQRGSYVAER
ncbi:GntR family transcriptional regulator [Planosporangium sp. 12N6]|uniref:GntR family transcriptional regulator n=1 Tax=Planosporangium spinosum TaxID=3402278 RepID=UPI003CEB0B30